MKNSDIPCRTLDLRNAELVNGSRLIEGIGYDGNILELGVPSSDSTVNQAEAYLELSGLTGDSVTLQIFHLPYFPLHEGRGCRIGVSIDNGSEEIIEYLPEEWSKPWKLNVLRNSALSEVRLPIDNRMEKHKLRLRGIDSGMAIQRIVIDEGFFRPGYIGPSINLSSVK